MDPKLLQSMGLDAKSIQAMAQMDPKLLQSFGLDPNMVQHGTVKKISEDSLHSIPSNSPSVKVCLRCKEKTLLGNCHQTFHFQKFVDNT